MTAATIESIKRMFTKDRQAQGFKSQAHLDAFYRCFDHQKTCPVCTGPSSAYWSEADASWQPCGPACTEEQGLHELSNGERFEAEEPMSFDLQCCHDQPIVECVMLRHSYGIWFDMPDDFTVHATDDARWLGWGASKDDAAFEAVLHLGDEHTARRQEVQS